MIEQKEEKGEERESQKQKNGFPRLRLTKDLSYISALWKSTSHLLEMASIETRNACLVNNTVMRTFLVLCFDELNSPNDLHLH